MLYMYTKPQLLERERERERAIILMLLLLFCTFNMYLSYLLM